MSSNLPPGVSVNDLPGFNTVEVSRSIECSADMDDDQPCGFTGTVEGTLEHGIFQTTCPKCGAEIEHDEN